MIPSPQLIQPSHFHSIIHLKKVILLYQPLVIKFNVDMMVMWSFKLVLVLPNKNFPILKLILVFIQVRYELIIIKL